MYRGATFTQTSSGNSLPAGTSLRTRLSSLGGRGSLSTRSGLIRRSLASALTALSGVSHVGRRAIRLQRGITRTPRGVHRTATTLATLDSISGSRRAHGVLDALSLHRLRAHITRTLSSLRGTRGSLTSCGDRLISLRARPRHIRGTVCGTSRRLRRVHDHLSKASINRATLHPDRGILVRTRRTLLGTRVSRRHGDLRKGAILRSALRGRHSCIATGDTHLRRRLRLLRRTMGDGHLALARGATRRTISPSRTTHVRTGPLIGRRLRVGRRLDRHLVATARGNGRLVRRGVGIGG